MGVTSPMCPPCSAAWMAWLDYRLPPAPIRIDGTGIRRVMDIRYYHERRYREWRDTVLYQQGLIRRLCLEGGHVPAAAESRAVERVTVAGGLL